MMTAFVEKCIRSQSGDRLVLHLRMEGKCEKTEVFRVHEEDYLAAGAPCEGEILSASTLHTLLAREYEKKAYARAVKILASGDNTARTLMRKLIERGFGEEAARAAVTRLREEGYIKEEDMLLRQFAIFEKRMWGPGKFMPSLIAKGFSRDAIEEALRCAHEENIYQTEAVKQKLIAYFDPKDDAQQRALLYKYGFRP